MLKFFFIPLLIGVVVGWLLGFLMRIFVLLVQGKHKKHNVILWSYGWIKGAGSIKSWATLLERLKVAIRMISILALSVGMGCVRWSVGIDLIRHRKI